MTSKIKNIILFTAAAAVLILGYIFFIKKDPEGENLVSSYPETTSQDTDALEQDSSITRDFLSVLLSVKSIKLDDSIFSSTAFANLRDSSIFLSPSGDEGRPNPFAPIGNEVKTVAPPAVPIVPKAEDEGPITP